MAQGPRCPGNGSGFKIGKGRPWFRPRIWNQEPWHEGSSSLQLIYYAL
jgi:hypothetical protein